MVEKFRINEEFKKFYPPLAIAKTKKADYHQRSLLRAPDINVRAYHFARLLYDAWKAQLGAARHERCLRDTFQLKLQIDDGRLPIILIGQRYGLKIIILLSIFLF